MGIQVQETWLSWETAGSEWVPPALLGGGTVSHLLLCSLISGVCLPYIPSSVSSLLVPGPGKLFPLPLYVSFCPHSSTV